MALAAMALKSAAKVAEVRGDHRLHGSAYSGWTASLSLDRARPLERKGFDLFA